jgi:hypothetical protein
LEDMKNEVQEAGSSVREWAAEAGVKWQTLYRKIKKPHTVLLEEYDRLSRAAETLQKRAS